MSPLRRATVPSPTAPTASGNEGSGIEHSGATGSSTPQSTNTTSDQPVVADGAADTQPDAGSSTESTSAS